MIKINVKFKMKKKSEVCFFIFLLFDKQFIILNYLQGTGLKYGINFPT